MTHWRKPSDPDPNYSGWLLVIVGTFLGLLCVGALMIQGNWR